MRPKQRQAASAASLLERRHQVQPTAPKDRKQPKQKTGQERHAESKPEDRWIQRDLVEPGQVFWAHPDEKTHTAEGEAKSDQTSQEPEHEALEEELTGDLATGGPLLANLLAAIVPSLKL